MSNALEMAESFFPLEKYSLKKVANWLVGQIFPEWVYQYKDRKLIRLPAPKVLAMKILKISPPKPWINNSSFADAILAESEAMVEYYTREGIPQSQIVLTGAISNDILAQNIRNAAKIKADLYQKLGVKKNTPLILSALPPDQLYMVGGRPECDFKLYRDLVEYWVKTVSQFKKYNIIINLHPSVLVKDFKYLEKFGIKLFDDDVAKLIPACDLFIASVSSVIRWAIACGKPVINYDVYRFRYTDYNKVPGVIKIEEKKEFEAQLQLLTHNQDFYQQVLTSQQKSSLYWGNLDGQAHIRMIDLFKKLTNVEAIR